MEDKFIDGEAENYPQLNVVKRYLFGHKGYIAGGCFKRLFTGEKVKDYDMFFESYEDYAYALTYMRTSPKWEFAYSSDKVEAFRYKEDGALIELIHYIFGSPEEVISQFDFTITKIAMGRVDQDEAEFWLIMHPKFFEDLFLKRLVIDENLVKPSSTFDRVLRYAKYGYSPCRDSKLKLLQAISEMGVVSADDLSKSMYNGMD